SYTSQDPDTVVIATAFCPALSCAAGSVTFVVDGTIPAPTFGWPSPQWYPSAPPEGSWISFPAPPLRATLTFGGPPPWVSSSQAVNVRSVVGALSRLNRKVNVCCFEPPQPSIGPGWI